MKKIDARRKKRDVLKMNTRALLTNWYFFRDIRITMIHINIFFADQAREIERYEQETIANGEEN